MTPDRSWRKTRHGSGRPSCYGPRGRTKAAKLVRLLDGIAFGTKAGSRTVLSIIVAVLLTGIGLSCILTNVLDGHSTVFALP